MPTLPSPRRPHGTGSAALLLFLFLIAVFAAGAIGDAGAAPDFPPLSGRVIDEANVLTPGEREGLTAALADHEQRTGQQVVVVTLASLRGETIEDYGYQLGRHWGIGEQDKNTGALFIVAPKERKVRIEVGYGLEGVLTDAASRMILETIVLPAFRAGQMGPGIVAGTGAMLKTIVGEAPEAPPVSAKKKSSDEGSLLPLLFLFIIVLFVASALRRHRSAMPGGMPGGRSSRGRDHALGGMLGGLGGGLGGGMGGWGGGNGGGGGFSGGGGSFGGGGASGDW